MRTILLLCLSIPDAAFGQPAASPARFDVVSVRRSDPASASLAANPPVRNGRLKYTHVSLYAMLTEAFPVDWLHIRGGSSWAENEAYDVEAITSELSVPAARYREMVQAMLAERFHLVTHFEERQETLYHLVIDKKGLRLKATPEGSCFPVVPDGPPPPPDRFCGRYPVVQRQHFEGIGMRMAKLAEMLTFVVGNEVIDRTGLVGMFDVQLDYARPDDPNVPDGPPSIFTALPEQLGLTLEPAKGPVKVLVIDRAERPSEN
jgi:uncharacterized protein (TIGR03435 family)